MKHKTCSQIGDTSEVWSIYSVEGEEIVKCMSSVINVQKLEKDTQRRRQEKHVSRMGRSAVVV